VVAKLSKMLAEQGYADVCVQRGPQSVVVDPMSLQYLVGSEIEFQDGLEGATFVIRNPNAANTRSCGQFVFDLKRENAMGITVTPEAAARVHKALQQRGSGLGLRLAVKTSGCSRYAYALEFVDTVDDDGVAIVVDSHSLPLLDGTRLDWKRDELHAGFKFLNINATCGCDESFAV
jgi:iron-sulfur cluster assembly protein